MSPGPLVIATDFSDGAREALRWGCHLTERGVATSAEVRPAQATRLLHVVLTAEAHALYPLFELVSDGEGLSRQIQLHAESALDRLLVEAQRPCNSTEVQPVVHHARSVAEGILEFAQACDASLIVLGTHGRSGFRRWLLGSVTEQVVRRARCSVLCCPARVDGDSGLINLKRILAAVDLSDASAAVIERGCEFAELLGASLEVAHVIPEDRGTVPAYLAEGWRRPSMPELRERARDELVDLGARRSLSRFSVRYRVGAGRPPRALSEMATSSHSGLIVIASRTSSKDVHCLGSVAHGLLRRAECPVLVVQPLLASPSPEDAQEPTAAWSPGQGAGDARDGGSLD